MRGCHSICIWRVEAFAKFRAGCHVRHLSRPRPCHRGAHVFARMGVRPRNGSFLPPCDEQREEDPGSNERQAGSLVMHTIESSRQSLGMDVHISMRGFARSCTPASSSCGHLDGVSRVKALA